MYNKYQIVYTDKDQAFTGDSFGRSRVQAKRLFLRKVLEQKGKDFGEVVKMPDSVIEKQAEAVGVVVIKVVKKG
jgi:hypothetical protein